MSAPINPSLKDLPKVSIDLKSQLEGFNPDAMKKAETAIKNVLPSAEGDYLISILLNVILVCVECYFLFNVLQVGLYFLI